MNKKAGMSFEMIVFILAVIILIVLFTILYFTRGSQIELLASLKKVVWFT